MRAAHLHRRRNLWSLAFSVCGFAFTAARLDSSAELTVCKGALPRDEASRAALGDVLLQASTSGFKAPGPPADESDQPVEAHGHVEKKVENAIAGVVDAVKGIANKTKNSTAEEKTSDASAGISSSGDRRRRSTFQVSPPLKETAVRADENYKHDRQMSREESQEFQFNEPIPVKDAMEVSLSVILLGFVVLVMTSFYLVNWPNQDIQQATWRLFSTTTSVFLAVLLFSGTQAMMGFYEEIRGLPHAHGGDSPSSGDHDHDPGLETSDHFEPVSNHVLVIIFLRFLGLLLLLQVLLFFVDTKDVMLHGLSRLGSHIVAFAGIDVFAALQASGVYPDWMNPDYFRGFAFSVLLVWGVFDTAEYARWLLVRGNLEGVSKQDKARQDWFAECREGEHEAAGLILGLLLSQHVRHALTGIHAPLHGGAPQSKSFSHVWQLFFIGLLLGVMTIPIEMGVEILSRSLEGFSGRINLKFWGARLIRICRETLAMTMAWCFLYWGHWQFWYMTDDKGLGWGSQISATLSIAIILSALCFSGIVVIELILDILERLERTRSHQAGFVALGDSLGLVMGLGWETCFREAIKGASKLDFQRYLLTNRHKQVSNMVLLLLLCAVVMPAWILFVHPKAIVNRRADFMHSNRRRSTDSMEDFEN